MVRFGDKITLKNKKTGKTILGKFIGRGEGVPVYFEGHFGNWEHLTSGRYIDLEKGRFQTDEWRMVRKTKRKVL